MTTTHAELEEVGPGCVRPFGPAAGRTGSRPLRPRLELCRWFQGPEAAGGQARRPIAVPRTSCSRKGLRAPLARRMFCGAPRGARTKLAIARAGGQRARCERGARRALAINKASEQFEASSLAVRPTHPIGLAKANRIVLSLRPAHFESTSNRSLRMGREIYSDSKCARTAICSPREIFKLKWWRQLQQAGKLGRNFGSRR